MKSIQVFCLASVVLWGCVGLSGCSWGPAYQKVKGTVTFDGEPLYKAFVSFIPVETSQGTLFATGMTDENGFFTLTASEGGQATPGKGTTAGDYYVTIRRNKDKPSRYVDSLDGPVLVFDPLIPRKYSNQNTSDLKVVVEKKRVNEFTFELKSK